MRFKSIILLCLIFLACPVAFGQASRPGTQAAAPEQVTLVLLHVNDIHGQTQERTVGGKSVGGYARLATAVREVREKAAGVDGHKHARADLGMALETHVLLFHAGDEFSRGDGLTRATLGAANMALMNEIGFDAFTPGNGEFYDGWDNLRLRAKEAKFPFLMANVSAPLARGPPPGKPFVILQAGPVKVAVFGLCFVRTVLPSAWGLKVDDPIQTARKLVPELRKKADVVVALTHIGVDEDKKLAAAVGGIDVIVGGHSHTVLEHGLQVKGPDGKSVLIVQAGNLLDYLGRATLQLRRTDKGYRVAEAQADLIALDQTIKQDPKIKALIAKLDATTQPANKTTQPSKEQPVHTGKSAE